MQRKDVERLADKLVKVTSPLLSMEAAVVLRALLDRAEKAEAEVAQMTKAHDTVCGVAAEAAEALLDRPSAPETLAWAVVGEDGAVRPQTLSWNYDGAARHEAGGEQTVQVRVAIRVVADYEAG